jgi:hypothetical protein
MTSMIGLTDDPDIRANDLLLAKEMADTLHSTYPGHMWAVSVEGGMANVRDMALSGVWGFRLKVPLIYSASSFKKNVIRAGGELLERFNISRGKAGAEQAAYAPLSIQGHARFDT